MLALLEDFFTPLGFEGGLGDEVYGDSEAVFEGVFEVHEVVEGGVVAEFDEDIDVAFFLLFISAKGAEDR